MNRFEVRAIGQITDDSGEYIGVALKGDMAAVKALGRVYGQPVAIVAADLLDEAEKALAGLVDCHAHFTGEPGHDANVWAEADDKARTTLARIRGEMP